MKKLLVLTLTVIMAFSFAACGAPTVEVTGEETVAEDAVKPTSTPTPEPTVVPTPEPTPIPEPTMSPEEIAIQDWFEEILTYMDYGDESGSVILQIMLLNGDISEEQYKSISSPLLPQKLSDAWALLSRVNYYYGMSRFLNGEFEEITEAQENMYSHSLSKDVQRNIPHILLFNTKDKRERVANGISLIRQWAVDMSDDNRRAIEEMLFSDELTCGETFYLITYLNYTIDWQPRTWEITIDGHIYTMSEYFDYTIESYGKTISELIIESIKEWRDLNRTPNAMNEKADENILAHYTFKLPETGIEILPDDELEEIKGLNKIDELKYYFTQLNDDYALIILEEMYEAGDISDSDFTAEYAQKAEGLNNSRRSAYKSAASVLNEEYSFSLTFSDVMDCENELRFAFFNQKPLISLFDSKEKRNRMIYAINIINMWLLEPTNENSKAIENLFTTEGVTPGEILYMYIYFYKEDTFYEYWWDRKLGNGMTLEDMYLVAVEELQ